MSNRGPERIVVVGGGRWARVLIPELISVLRDDVPVDIVSPSAAHVMQQWLIGHPTLWARRMRVGTELPGVTNPDEVAIAIIANRPAEHFAAAEQLISCGYHVLVEKPLTTDPAQARRLVELGQRSRRAVMAGLVQLFAPYVNAFGSHLPFAASEIVGFELDWGDPAFERRYGEEKQLDTHTGIALDLVPHVWSLARAFLGTTSAITMALADGEVAGDDIKLTMRTANCSGDIRLSRSAPERRRRLRLRSDALAATLDFSKQPFTATIAGKPSLVLSERTDAGGGLTHEIRFFMTLADDIQSGCEPPDHPAVGKYAIEHVELACAIENALRAKRSARMKSSMP